MAVGIRSHLLAYFLIQFHKAIKNPSSLYFMIMVCLLYGHENLVFFHLGLSIRFYSSNDLLMKIIIDW